MEEGGSKVLPPRTKEKNFFYIFTLLDFRSTLEEELILVGQPTTPRKRGRPSSLPSDSVVKTSYVRPNSAKFLEFRPLSSVNQNQISHYPKYDEKKEATRFVKTKTTRVKHM